jgi:hypothetical protein
VSQPSNTYQKIVVQGGLAQALQERLSGLKSTLVVESNPIDPKSVIVQRGNRYCKCSLSEQDPPFHLGFWHDNLSSNSSWHQSLSTAAKWIMVWVEYRVSAKALAEASGMEFSDLPEISGTEQVKRAWKKLVENTTHVDATGKPGYYQALAPVVKLAAKDKVLSKLYPFTSHTLLCFSSQTLPFPEAGTVGMPFVEPSHTDAGMFIVRANKNETGAEFGDVIGTGDAKQTIKFLKSALPANCPSATKLVDGEAEPTSDDAEAALGKVGLF